MSYQILPTNRFSVNPQAMADPNHRAGIAPGLRAFSCFYMRGAFAARRSPNGNSGARMSEHPLYSLPLVLLLKAVFGRTPRSASESSYWFCRAPLASPCYGNVSVLMDTSKIMPSTGRPSASCNWYQAILCLVSVGGAVNSAQMFTS